MHWLHVLLQRSTSNDVAAIRGRFAIDDAKLARDVVAALDALPRGATAISDFSPLIEEAAGRAGSPPPCSSRRARCAPAT